MPIYEYFCTGCEREHEVIQKVSDAPMEECPSCHELKLVKKTSRSAFHLKGGGWYKDGYGPSSTKGKETSTTAAASTPKSTTTESKSTSTDSKTTSTESKSAAGAKAS